MLKKGKELLKTVAIVCEYNPFHLGHEHQIREVRKRFGEDTAIVAIMSGNYTERGDVAVLGKFDRARIAVENGVSLVLELPFPFSAAPAEFFSRAAVGIAHKLGCVDFLSFGSECGDIPRLSRVAERTASPDFLSALAETSKADGSKNGHAQNLSALYARLYGEEDVPLLSSPNNILAIEYLKALSALSSPILPHTVLRVGTDKDGECVTYPGATYLREALLRGDTETTLKGIPENAHEILESTIQNGICPASLARLSSPILAAIRLNSCTKDAAECSGGVYELLSKTAISATSLDELFSLAATKKYTAARLRRALLFSYFGVTPSMLRADALYTQVLAMDSQGMAILRHIRKNASIAILTKPADLQKLSPPAKAQAQMNYRADSIYSLATPIAGRADAFVRATPYRK